MKYCKYVLCLTIGIMICALAGCAGSKTATTADLMRTHASEAQAQVDLKNQLAKDWEKGQKLIKSGEKNIRDGEKRVRSAEQNLKRGRDQLDRGKREVDEGSEMVRRAEERFREAFPGLELKGGKK